MISSARIHGWRFRSTAGHVAAFCACVVVAGIALPALAQQTPPSAMIQPPAEPVDAKALLLRMADHLAKAQRFSVTMETGYDAVQSSGQKIEFGETRKILLSRPDNLLRSIRSLCEGRFNSSV